MSGSVNLQGAFDVGQNSTTLKAVFEVRQSGSVELKAVFEIQSSTTLKAVFEVRQSGSVELKAVFDVGQNSTTLKAVFEVRQSGSVELKAVFDVGQNSTTLKAVFDVGQNSTTLKGILRVEHAASVNLHAEFSVKIHFSGTPRNLKAVFQIDWPDEEIFAKFTVKNKSSVDLPSVFVALQPGSQNLFAHMVLKYFFVEGWADEKAILVVRQASSVALAAHFIIRNDGEVDGPEGIVTVRHSDNIALLTDVIVRHTSSIDGPKGVTSIRHPSAVSLKAVTRIRHSASTDGPKGVLVVQKWAALKSTFRIRRTTSTTLKAVFWTRFPSRLWTNRRYLNGVVSLKELDMGDAVLEYVIEGVMEDIQGTLESNNISYSDWTDITRVPTLIRRATTFGVVASLYARKSKTFRSRVIPTVTPVNVVVTGDDERAMQYWEGLMDDRLNTYLTTIDTDRMLVSTIDDEPFFTVDDIVPRKTAEQSWHDWNAQREE